MNIWKQIGLGALVLGASVVSHVGVLGFGIEVIRLLATPDEGALRGILVITVAAGFILAGQTVQVLIWALAFRGLGALERMSDAIYFAMVTMTTLGYGDITLSPRFRAFGAMAAIAGLMTFGLSTAILVGVVSGLMHAST